MFIGPYTISAFIAAGFSLCLGVLCFFFSSFLSNRSQWLLLALMALLQASYCIENAVYMQTTRISDAELVVGIMSASLCFMTYLMGQLTKQLLSYQKYWFDLFQWLCFLLTCLFSASVVADLIWGFDVVLETVVFDNNSMHRRLAKFSPFGQSYLAFVNTSFFIYSFLLVKAYLKGRDLKYVVAGLLAYYLSVISDFNILFGFYDFYFIQHFGFLVLVVSLVLYFAKDYSDVTQGFKEAKQKIEEQEKLIFQAGNENVLAKAAIFIGHEIRNPLGVIGGNSYLLKRKINSDDFSVDDIYRFIDKNQRSINSIQKIVDGIYSLVRQEEFERSWVSIEEIMANVELFSKEDVKKAQARLSMVFDSSSKVYCSPSQVTQVLVNLVQQTSRIVVEAQEKLIELYCEDNPNWTCFKLVYGKTLSPEDDYKSIVGKLESEDEMDEHGIGQAIIREIIARHHGNIEIEEKGEYTNVIVKFPKPV